MSYRQFKIRRQKPVKGGRTALPACVMGEIARRVEQRATRFRVSKSFVVAVILAKELGIDDQESYLPQSKAEGGKS